MGRKILFFFCIRIFVGEEKGLGFTAVLGSLILISCLFSKLHYCNVPMYEYEYEYMWTRTQYYQWLYARTLNT